MAVQAQYPSNVLLLDRTVQESKSPPGNDFLLKPQTGGGGGVTGGGGGTFLDHTNMSFNHGVGTNNSRKRGREAGGIATATADCPLISSIQQQSQLIDLTQLHNSQRNVVSTGLGLAFGEPQQQQQQPQQQQQHSLSPQSSAQSSLLLSIISDDLSTHIKQQRDEIEHFLHSQGVHLQRMLAEKKQRHYRALLTSAEESVARRLREKETEVENAVRRNAELEAKTAQLNMEAQAWQARARMQESMAATLQLQLQQAMINCGGRVQSGAGVQDGGDEWGGGGGNSAAVIGGDAEDAESAYIDPDRVVASSGPSCKACRKRVASVVLLPCRHLCLCSQCDSVAQACPVCFSPRCSSVEVYLC